MCFYSNEFNRTIMKIERLTLVLYVKKRFGILSDILDVCLGHNIGTSEVNTSRSYSDERDIITIEIFSNKKYIEGMISTIDQIDGVNKCFMLLENELIYKKVALFKFSANAFLDKSIFKEIVESSHAQIIEINRDVVIMSKVGEEFELEKFYKKTCDQGLMQYAISSRALCFTNFQQVLEEI